MGSMLSPGVYTHEIDMSVIIPAVATSVGAFAGIFSKGKVGEYSLVSTIDDLILQFGQPTNTNYNDWFQCYSFLLYGNKLLVSRAIDINGSMINTISVTTASASAAAKLVEITAVSNFTVGDKVTFAKNNAAVYTIDSIAASSITLVEALKDSVVSGATIEKFTKATNAVVEVQKAGSSTVPTADEAKKTISFIPNNGYFEDFGAMIGVSDISNVAIKFIAKNPGEVGNNISIAIGNTADFIDNATTTAMPGVTFNQIFDRYPSTSEIAIVITEDGILQEKFIVSLDKNAKDYNNKSTYIEDVLNRQSAFVYAIHNDTVLTCATRSASGTNIATLQYGSSGLPNFGDIEVAYDVFSNKEEVDVDIIIANEAAHLAASTLASNRADCIAFVGSKYEDVIGQKAADIVAKEIEYVNGSGSEMNLNTSFVAFYDNYAQFYDKWNDKLRWCNVAGLVAGLRAKTSQDFDISEASAGLVKGVLKGLTKLYYTPNQGQRDQRAGLLAA